MEDFGREPKKKRRTLKDATADLQEVRGRLKEAKQSLINLATENAKMKVLLQTYMEKDDSLLSSSQLSGGECSQEEFQCKENDEGNKGVFLNSPLVSSQNEDLNPKPDLCLASIDNFSCSQSSLLSDFGSSSQLDDVIQFLEREGNFDNTRLEDLENEVGELKNSQKCVRVGVGVIILSTEHPDCVLIGKRKGSHGAGRLALPGGHLELNESWETCGRREVLEETGLNLDSLKFANVTNDIMEAEGKHYITIFMTSEIETGATPVNLEPEKCEGWEWMQWNELKDVLSTNPERLFIPMQNLLSTSYSPFN